MQADARQLVNAASLLNFLTTTSPSLLLELNWTVLHGSISNLICTSDTARKILLLQGAHSELVPIYLHRC